MTEKTENKSKKQKQFILLRLIHLKFFKQHDKQYSTQVEVISLGT